MTEEQFRKATCLREKVLNLGDLICNLNYCLKELKEENRDITVSIDQSPDIHSIPINKDTLIKHIEEQLKYNEQEFERHKRKFEKL